MQIPLNFSPDASYKYYIIFKILPKKSFEFFLNNENYIITFYLSFMLLLIKVDLIVEKQSRKKDGFGACSTGYIKIILILLIEIIVLHMQILIIDVKVLALEDQSLSVKFACNWPCPWL